MKGRTYFYSLYGMKDFKGTVPEEKFLAHGKDGTWTAINPQIERELIRGDWKVFKSRKGKE